MQNNTSFADRAFRIFCHFAAAAKIDFADKSALARLDNKGQISGLLELGFQPREVTIFEPGTTRYNQLWITRPGANLIHADLSRALSQVKDPSLAYFTFPGEWSVHLDSATMTHLCSPLSEARSKDVVIGVQTPVGPGGEGVVWQGIRSLAVALALFPDQAPISFLEVKCMLGKVRATSQVRLSLREFYFMRYLLRQVLASSAPEVYARYVRAEDVWWKKVLNVCSGPPLTIHRLNAAVHNVTDSTKRLISLLQGAKTNIDLASRSSVYWTGGHSRLYQSRSLHLKYSASTANAWSFYHSLVTGINCMNYQVLKERTIQTVQRTKRVQSKKCTLWTMDYGLY